MQVSLNDLSRWSPWPARLLGLDPWTVPDRTVGKVDAEYDKGKYFNCMRFFESQPGPVLPRDVREFDFGISTDTEMCVSVGQQLEIMPFIEVDQRFDTLVRSRMKEYAADATVVVELGSGYGYNLSMLRQDTPGKQYVGGEYSQNAVDLGGLLFKDDPSVRVVQFNYYDADFDAVFGDLAGESVVVYTVHSVEQIPRAGNIVEVLSRYGDRIKNVVHFEPVYEFYDDSLLGLLRKQYTIACDYNRDLYTCLEAHDGAVVTAVEKDIIGMNPLNPTSIIQWHPAG